MIKAIITTLDNLPTLERQVEILLGDELVDEIVVVNNGSIDGTKKWLESKTGLVQVVNHEENRGASVGRNSGLGAAGKFDYCLLLDGGILPLRNGTSQMLAYLEKHPEVDVISPEVASCFTTDTNKAHRRMLPINEKTCFPQRAISSTAYALCRYTAFDGIRFCEDGPFGMAGWAVEDNDMAFRWNEAAIIHHDFSGVLVYRHQAGSFARLYKETGIYPNQYGSVYEQRNVMCFQRWQDKYYDPIWHQTRVDVSCVILGWNEFPMFARAIKILHEDLNAIPHEIIFVNNGSTDGTKSWLDTFALRWPWGDTVVDSQTGEIIRRVENPDLEPIWTGNVIRVDLPENRGVGEGYNAGFRKARGKYVFFLSGDILPVMGSVTGLFEYLEAHDDAHYVSVNPWCCQDKTKDVEFEGFGHLPRQGLGNYAGSYAMFQREVLNAGCKLADEGPFAGPGCGFEEAEFANLMYSKGFRCYTFNQPAYYHQRRDFKRSGHEEEEKQTKLEERRRWLRTRWPGCRFDICHHQTQPPERHVRNVAVVYKASTTRPGIGGGLLTALQTICNAQHFEPGQEQPGFDDYLYVDNGDYDYFLCPEFAHPSIFWAIDMITPQQTWRPSLDQYVKRARTFDKVFAAQPSAAEHFAENEINAEWLPLAANPDIHKPYKEDKIYDWITLWHNCGKRPQLIKELKKTLPNGYVGWKDGDDYARWMSKALCSISLSRSNELAMRIFEVMGIGVPLITDRTRGLDLLFTEKQHYLGFDDADELIWCIEYVMNHPGECARMAYQAQQEVLGKHTYYHRVLRVFG